MAHSWPDIAETQATQENARPVAGVPLKAVRPNHVWTYDFVFDTTQDGRKLKFLTLVDEFTRESLAIEGRSLYQRT